MSNKSIPPSSGSKNKELQLLATCEIWNSEIMYKLAAAWFLPRQQMLTSARDTTELQENKSKKKKNLPVSVLTFFGAMRLSLGLQGREHCATQGWCGAPTGLDTTPPFLRGAPAPFFLTPFFWSSSFLLLFFLSFSFP